MKRSIQKGFTLVELLIVVIILAILAAIVVPQFSASTDDAKVSSLKATLAGVRSAIDLYYQQHGKYPSAITPAPGGTCTGAGVVLGAGAVDSDAAFTEQMTLYTNAAGGACSSQMASLFTLGPYLKQGLPADPIMNVSTLTVVAAGNLSMIADGVLGGWKYDNKTGRFIMNHTTYDDL